MKISLLADNTTLIDKYYLGEPAFSAFIQDGSVSILFDTGYSDVYLHNGLRMNVPVKDAQYVCLSHGHMDHTWGLDSLVRYYTELDQESVLHARPALVAHPSVFRSISAGPFGEAGALVSEKKLERFFDMKFSIRPQYLTQRLVFLGEIPRVNDFEAQNAVGSSDGNPDYVRDDSALVYIGENGLVIITGCSHSGICNCIEYAKHVTGKQVIQDIIGGFHLLDPSQKQLEGTCRYMHTQQIQTIHPCHCTDLRSKIALASAVPVVETGVGARYEYM